MILLIDECVARPLLVSLRKLAADVVSVAEEALGMPDAEVLRWAEREARILVT